MIRKLRIKISVILSVVLTIVIVGVMITINFIERSNNQTQINERLLKTAYNNGVIPNEYRNRNNNSDTGYIDTFSVLIDGAYNLIGIYAGRTDAISQDEYIDYANQAIK